MPNTHVIKSNPNFTIGRAGPWSKEQRELIFKTSIPEWHEFSLVKHKDKDGRDMVLTKWKKIEAAKLLLKPEFKVLPNGVSLFSDCLLLCWSVTKMTQASAMDALVRKFTNYRNTRKRGLDEVQISIIENLKIAAAAIVDLKTYSKGKTLFKMRKSAEILARRDELVEENQDLSQVGAYQKALKELWVSADQEFWEAQAASVADDIYE